METPTTTHRAASPLTIVTDISPDNDLVVEERLVGAVIIRYNDIEEAIAEANKRRWTRFLGLVFGSRSCAEVASPRSWNHLDQLARWC